MGNEIAKYISIAFNGFAAPKKKVLILGLDGCGKTTLFNKYRFENSVLADPTIGMNQTSILYGRFIQFDFIDMSGGESSHSKWGEFYKKSDALIYIIDNSDNARFDQSINLLDSLRIGSDDPRPVVVLLNKQDVSNAERDIIFHTIKCTLTKEGIDLRWLIDQLYTPPSLQDFIHTFL